MPKKEYKKLGDPKFDQKQSVKIPNPRTEDELDQKYDYIFDLKIKKLIELMEHFDIDPQSDGAWFELSFNLAEHFVPGMQLAKQKGQPKKWNFFGHVALYALVDRIQRQQPNLSRKEVFIKLPDEAQRTSLSVIIKSDTKPTTLESVYDRFVPSDEGILFQYRLNNFVNDRTTCLENLLTDSYKKILEKTIEEPHLVGRLYHEAFMASFIEK